MLRWRRAHSATMHTTQQMQRAWSGISAARIDGATAARSTTAASAAASARLSTCHRCLSITPFTPHRGFSSDAHAAPSADWRSIAKKRLKPPKPEKKRSNDEAKAYRLLARLGAAERAQIGVPPTVALLFRRAAILTDESAWTHPRRGRDTAKSMFNERDKHRYAGVRNKEALTGPEATVHTTEALEHARTCNEVVRRILEIQRQSVTLSKETADATIVGGQPEVIRPFCFKSSQWFLLLGVLRSLPGELVEESTIDALWSAISTAHIKPAAWDSLTAAHGEKQLNDAAAADTASALDGSIPRQQLRPFSSFTPNAKACNMLMTMYVARQGLQQSLTDLSKVLMIWFWMREQGVAPEITTIQLLFRNLNWCITQKLRAGAVAGLQKATSSSKHHSQGLVNLDAAESANMAEVLTIPASMEEIAEMGRIRSGKLAKQVAAASAAAAQTDVAPAAAAPATASSSPFVTQSIQLERQMFEEIWVVWESICRGTDAVTNARLATEALARAQREKEEEERKELRIKTLRDEITRNWNQQNGEVTIVQPNASEQPADAEEKEEEDEDENDEEQQQQGQQPSAFQPLAAQPDTPAFVSLRFAAESFKDVATSVTAARRAAGEPAASTTSLLSVSASLPPLPSLPLAAPRPFLVQAPWFVAQSHRDQFFHAEVLRYLSLVAHPALATFFAGEIMARVSGLDVGAGRAGQELYDLGGSKIQGDATTLHQVVGSVERALKILEAVKEIKIELSHRRTTRARASTLSSTLASLETLGARHDLIYLFTRFWETMESIGVRTDDASILQRMRILTKAGSYEQVKAVFESLHPDASLNVHARQESPALLNPYALARRAKQDLDSSSSGNKGSVTAFTSVARNASNLALDVVTIYATAVHALRHLHPSEFESVLTQQSGEQLALMIERGASAAAVASSSAGLPVCPLPPALLSTPISSPFAHYLRQYVLAPVIHSPSLWSFLSRTFFVQIMLALERQAAEEAHAQQSHKQQAKLPSFARVREELHASSSSSPSSASNDDMWLIFTQLRALRAAQLSAPLSLEDLDPSNRGPGRRKFRFEAHRMMTLEFFCILLRNLHRAFKPQHLDEKGWGRTAAGEASDPGAQAARAEYLHRVESVFDECLSIYGPSMRDLMRETAAGRAALKTGLEDWTLLRDAPRAVMGPAVGAGSAGLPSEATGSAPITFVMLLNNYFEALSRVPEGCASVESTFERFFTRQPAAQLKDAARAAAMELKQKEMSPSTLVQMQLRPNPHTVTAVLRCYLRSGVGSDRIQAFVRGLANRFNVAPVALNYQAIIASIAEICERRWEERQSAATEPQAGATQPGLQALALYREMLTKQLLPSSPLYQLLLHALATLHPSIPVPVFVPVSSTAAAGAGAASSGTAAASAAVQQLVAPSVLVERVLQELQEDRARRDSSVLLAGKSAPPVDLSLKVSHFEPLFEAYARAAEVAFADANAERLADLATLVGELTQKSHRLLQYLFERGLGLGVAAQGHADTTTKQLVNNVQIERAVRKLIVLRHALVLRLPPSHPLTVSTPPLIPTLVALQRSFLTKHSRKAMMAAGGPVEVLLRDAIHELHRLDRGSHSALLSLSLSSLASFLKDVLLISYAPAEPLLCSTHYAQLMYLYTAFPAMLPLVTEVNSSVADQWLPGWALFGRSQLEGVAPSPRLILSVFHLLHQAHQHSAGAQLYSNMLFMDQIDMPSNVHAMVWTQVMHLASAASASASSSVSQDRIDLDAWLSSTSNTGLCMTSPWTVARSLMFARFHTMSALDLFNFWKVLQTRPTEAAAAENAEAEDGSSSSGNNATHERARLARASASEVVRFWERLLCTRGLTPYLGRVSYVDLLSLSLGPELDRICISEEDLAAEAAALEVGETDAPRILPANPLDSPVSSAASRTFVAAHVSGVLSCCLESLRAKKRAYPEKSVSPMLIRVGAGSGADLSEDQQIYLPRDLRTMVSQQLQAIGLAHATVQLNANQVHEQFKPFPASAPRKSLAGEYLRVESHVLTAFLRATTDSNARA